MAVERSQTWLNQLVQAAVLALAMGGYLAYVLATDEPSAQLVTNHSTTADQPNDWHVEYRDPNHLCMPTVAMARERRRALSTGHALYSTGDPN
jgi:hypothetical protein